MPPRGSWPYFSVCSLLAAAEFDARPDDREHHDANGEGRDGRKERGASDPDPEAEAAADADVEVEVPEPETEADMEHRWAGPCCGRP